jgi:hypothetical protein
MKRTAGLLAAFLLCSMIALQGQDKSQDQNSQDQNKGTEMTGTLCNAANVVETAGKATCDPSKGGGSDDMVFIDDQGKATTIANTEKVKGMSGQKVKVSGETKKIKDQDRMWIYNLQHIPSGI